MTVLPDVLQENLKVVFCGTAAGRKSAEVGSYYAGPGNQFWSVLHRVGLTPHKLEPAQFQDLVQYGIGLTDLAQKTSGMDKDLRTGDFDARALQQKMLVFEPKVLAFNGKKAASVYFKYFKVDTDTLAYGLQTVTIGKSAIFVLPSTASPARGFWDERHWQALADYL